MTHLPMIHVVQQGSDLVEPNVLEKEIKLLFQIVVTLKNTMFHLEKYNCIAMFHLEKYNWVFAGVLHEKALEVV